MFYFMRNFVLGFSMFLIIICLKDVQAQGGNSNNCSRIFRGLRRAGINIAGRLEIPVDTDDSFPKFQLRLKFNRPLASLTVRQLRAKNMGQRREFLIDPMDLQEDGIMKLSTYIRLTHTFASPPRLMGVVYNGKLICGGVLFSVYNPMEMDALLADHNLVLVSENVFSDGIVVQLKTTTPRWVPIVEVTTQKSKYQEDDEEIFN